MISRKPRLSIVVVVFNMRREAERTLHSLSPSHQRDLVDANYEVIAIDNGSSEPLDAVDVARHGTGFRYHFHETDSVSPVGAVNLGLELARGETVAVIVDGARMASPGLVGETQRALRSVARPFVVSLSWHLGPEVQNLSMLSGYDQAEEDRLLDGISWPRDGYRLFEISTLAQSSGAGFGAGVPVECSWWAMLRTDVMELGGFDERFQTPGGGLVNHDFRDRALALPGVAPIVVLGEGVFHQFHGGVATNVVREEHPMGRFRAEYQQIHDTDYAPAPSSEPRYFGRLPAAVRPFMA